MEKDRRPDPAQDPEAARVDITRRYAVAPDKVWRAWTDPQALSQWFGPGEMPSRATAEIDLRVGGVFRIAFPMKDNDVQEASGVYQAVEPPHRLVFSWAWKGTPERVSRITIELTPSSDGTELHFVHDRFFDATARDNHARGWALFFDNLDAFIQPGTREA